MAENTTILQTISRGAKLSLTLYEFGASVASVSHEVESLAKGVNLLSLTLRQTASSWKQDQSVRSIEAQDAVREILGQCRNIFTKVEILVSGTQRHGGSGEKQPFEPELNRRWDDYQRAKARYLLAHLDALRSTLSVLLQTFRTVNIIMRSRQQQTESSADAISTERLQLQSLIIEQQLSLLRTHRLYGELRKTPKPLEQKPESQSSSAVDESLVNPGNLIRFQERSLAALQSQPTDTESLAMVVRISSRFVDESTARWSRLREIERRPQRAEFETQETRRRELFERRRGQQPSVKSDESSDDDTPRTKSPNSRLSGRESLLSPVNPVPYPSSNSSLPMPMPFLSVNTGSVPTTPTSSRAWSASNSSPYFPNPVSPSTSVKSVGYSPGSARSSYSGGQQSRPGTASKDDKEAEDVGLGIPWRLCFSNHQWNFIDDKLVNSNTPIGFEIAYSDRDAWTEIVATWVTKEAIKDIGYKYDQIQRERGDGPRRRSETCFVIYKALTFEEVERLVERTATLYSRSQQHAPRPTIAAPSPSKPHPPPPRPLDRATTMPLPFTNGYLEPSAARHDHDHRSSGSYSQSHSQPYRHRSRGPRDSPSTTSDSDTAPRPRSRRGSGSSKRRGKGATAVSTLSKITAGAGIATLLDGLADAL